MSEPGDKTKDISDIQPDRLIKYRVSDDRFSAEVLLPGLWYTDFDKKIGGKGKWSLWSLAKVTESIRFTAMPKGFIYYYDLLAENHGLFIAANTYTLTPKAHEINYRDNWAVKFPLRFELDVVHLGETSFIMETKMYDAKSGELLVSALSKYVFVSFKSRRAEKLPSWFTSKAVPAIRSKTVKSIPKTGPVTIPKSAFQYHVKALHSDVDMNGHVNQSVFPRWCVDAGDTAASEAFYSFLQHDVSSYDVEHIEMYYGGEAMANDAIVVNTWEEPNNARKIHFCITKGKRQVCTVLFTYFDKKPDKFYANSAAKL